MGLYLYCLGNPFDYLDFDGERPFSDGDKDSCLRILDTQGINSFKSCMAAVRGAGKNEKICHQTKNGKTRYYPCSKGPGVIEDGDYDSKDEKTYEEKANCTLDGENCRNEHAGCLTKSLLKSGACFGLDVATTGALTAVSFSACAAISLITTPLGGIICGVVTGALIATYGTLQTKRCIKEGNEREENCKNQKRECYRKAARKKS